MPALLVDRHPNDVGDSVDHEWLQTSGTVVACGDEPAPTPFVPHRELLRVLVVDDYRASADTMCRLVATWGHDVRRAYDGATGMALASAFQPDVLLLDLIMSEACGLALAQQMRRQARVNNCLTIAVTAAPMPDTAGSARRRALTCFSSSPWIFRFCERCWRWNPNTFLRAQQHAERNHSPQDLGICWPLPNAEKARGE